MGPWTYERKKEMGLLDERPAGMPRRPGGEQPQPQPGPHRTLTVDQVDRLDREAAKLAGRVEAYRRARVFRISQRMHDLAIVAVCLAFGFAVGWLWTAIR